MSHGLRRKFRGFRVNEEENVTTSLETPALSLLSTTATLVNDPADPHPAFHQNHTTSYPTWVVPQDPHLGPSMAATSETICFRCHTTGHLCVNCPNYECPNCWQPTPGHPQYCCLHNYCSFCWCFGHSSHYCPDWQCTLCNVLGHVVTDCPFSEDPSSGVIVTIHGDNILFCIVHLPPLSSDLPYLFTISIIFFADNYRYIVC